MESRLSFSLLLAVVGVLVTRAPAHAQTFGFIPITNASSAASKLGVAGQDYGVTFLWGLPDFTGTGHYSPTTTAGSGVNANAGANNDITYSNYTGSITLDVANYTGVASGKFTVMLGVTSSGYSKAGTDNGSAHSSCNLADKQTNGQAGGGTGQNYYSVQQSTNLDVLPLMPGESRSLTTGSLDGGASYNSQTYTR